MIIKFLMPFIGAFIGWITNKIAIIMLFRPRKPRKILFFTIQGLLPKYKDDVAQKVGDVIKKHLLDTETIKKWITEKGGVDKAVNAIIELIEKEFKINRIILSMLKPVLKAAIEGALERGFLEKALSAVDFGKIVEDKIRSFNLEELEKLVFTASGREIRFIILMGGVIGFFVGIVQMIIALL